MKSLHTARSRYVFFQRKEFLKAFALRRGTHDDASKHRDARDRQQLANLLWASRGKTVLAK